MTPDELALSGCTCFAVRRVDRVLSRLYDHYLAKSGIRITQYSMLRRIEDGPATIATLAVRLAMDRTTLTRNLRPLAAAGWIAIEPGSDLRERIVTLTKSGKAKIAEARSMWRAAQIDIDASLGSPLIERLHADLRVVLKTVSPLVEAFSNEPS